MGVKILAINGSPRKGGTEHALRQALKAAEATGDVQTELVNLRGKELHFCIHCNRCLKRDVLHCPAFDDGMSELYPKILEADALLVGSPVYQMNPSAQTTAFVNRLRPLGKLIARGGFALKAAGAVAVGGTRNGGQDTTLAAIDSMMLASGFLVVSGGVYAYNGGAVWSNGRSARGAEEDEIGLDTVRLIGRRLAVVAGLLKEGAKQLQIEPCRLAGFADEKDVARRTGAFRKG